jgi:hypothetical protein
VFVSKIIHNSTLNVVTASDISNKPITGPAQWIVDQRKVAIESSKIIVYTGEVSNNQQFLSTEKSERRGTSYRF